MSKKYPECPLTYTDACKDWENPKICAIVRKDKVCFRKKPVRGKKTAKSETMEDARTLE